MNVSREAGERRNRASPSKQVDLLFSDDGVMTLPLPGDPPAFLQMAAHPVRWRLLHELARSDRQVGELVGLVRQPQSLVSYHLRRLGDEQLVTARRSSADRRYGYYSANLTRCRQLLADVGPALYPGLQLRPVVPTGATPMSVPCRVLFLCTGNSARSQMAEAFLQHLSGNSIDGNGIDVRSAGSRPTALHPNAVRAMAEHGIDVRGRRAKHLDEFAAIPFDYVITMCDRVREICPEFPGHPEAIHWSISNPTEEGDSDEATYPAFQRVAAELDNRVSFLLQLILAQ
jgi:ArsR family transcriptional regulator, arsenate/arsenite/antimonite-responsive transcriptional repressor / arsenate reductase (thioredoxin)